MLNAYAGGVGELLGVSLFAVIWLVLVRVLIVRSADFPNWPAAFRFVTAASLVANRAEVVGVEVGLNLTLLVVFLQF